MVRSFFPSISEYRKDEKSRNDMSNSRSSAIVKKVCSRLLMGHHFHPVMSSGGLHELFWHRVLDTRLRDGEVGGIGKEGEGGGGKRAPSHVITIAWKVVSCWDHTTQHASQRGGCGWVVGGLATIHTDKEQRFAVPCSES